MWIKLIAFVLYLVNVTAATVLNFTFCGKRKNDESAAEKDSANKQLANEKPMEESGKSEQNSERTDSGCSLGADNTRIQLVIAETENKECSEVYMSNLGNILETANNYMWAMKKHMAADQAAWKELAKRITLLRAEGYDVRAGTKEAKLRRLVTAKQQSSLMQQVTKKKMRKSADAE